MYNPQSCSCHSCLITLPSAGQQILEEEITRLDGLIEETEKQETLAIHLGRRGAVYRKVGRNSFLSILALYTPIQTYMNMYTYIFTYTHIHTHTHTHTLTYVYMCTDTTCICKYKYTCT